jgi:hypothetical protein
MPSYNPPTGDPGEWLKFLQSIGDPGTQSPYANYVDTLPWTSIYSMEETPQKGWSAYSSIANTGQTPNYKKWMEGQYSQNYGKYSAMANADPTYWWSQYLSNLNSQNDFNWASPTERGTNNTWENSPTMRMVW